LSLLNRIDINDGEFTCPICGAEGEVEDDVLPGGMVECPSCVSELQVGEVNGFQDDLDS